MIRTAAASFVLTCIALCGAAQASSVPALAPASAGQDGYVAVVASGETTARGLIVRERMWRCDAAGTCRGPANTGSPATACALIAREVGTLARFTANGRELDADALARCNARAR